jgi:hypothetical protein
MRNTELHHLMAPLYSTPALVVVGGWWSYIKIDTIELLFVTGSMTLAQACAKYVLDASCVSAAAVSIAVVANDRSFQMTFDTISVCALLTPVIATCGICETLNVPVSSMYKPYDTNQVQWVPGAVSNKQSTLQCHERLHTPFTVDANSMGSAECGAMLVMLLESIDFDCTGALVLRKSHWVTQLSALAANYR